MPATQLTPAAPPAPHVAWQPATDPASQTALTHVPAPRTLRELDFRNATLPIEPGGPAYAFRNSRAPAAIAAGTPGSAPWRSQLQILDVAREDLDGDGRDEAAVLVLLPLGWTRSGWWVSRVVVYAGSPQRLRVVATRDFSHSLENALHLTAAGHGRLEITGHYWIHRGCIPQRGADYHVLCRLRRGALVEIARRPPLPIPPRRTRRERTEGIPTAARTGYLRLRTDPWTRIYIDGRDTGLTTPQTKLSLPAGKHVVRLENEGERVRHEFTVVIKAGEYMTKVLDLSHWPN